MPKTDTPTGNRSTAGRNSGGRFAHGNPGGPGRPPNAKALMLRRVLLDTVTEQDMREIVEKLVDQAKAGELDAIRDLLDRICGRPASADLQAEVDELRQRLEALQDNRNDAEEVD